MSFTTLNSFNSNLWKGGVIKPTLYELSVRTADISVNSITVNYRYSGASYVTMDIIGSSGYISSQPRYNVISSPVTNIITGLNPNTYYNFVLVPYDKNDISGSSYYFSGFSGGVSSFTSSTNAITSISTPINYSNIGKPFCTLSAIYNLVVSAYDFSSVDLSFNYTDLSYVSIIQTGYSTNNYNKRFNELTGTFNSTNNIYSLNSKIQNTGLTILKSYTYNITPYNISNVAGTSLTVSGVSWPSFLNNINGYNINSYSNVTQLSIINNYILINFNTNGNITFNRNITGNTLLVGCGGNGGRQLLTDTWSNWWFGGGGGGGGGYFVNENISYNSLNYYSIFMDTISNKINGKTKIIQNDIIIKEALNGENGYNSRNTNYMYKKNTWLSGNGGNSNFLGGLSDPTNITVSTSYPYGYGGAGGGGGAGGQGGAGLAPVRGTGSNSNYYYGGVGGPGGIGYTWPINGNTYGNGGNGGNGGTSLTGYLSVNEIPECIGGNGNTSGICIIAIPFY